MGQNYRHMSASERNYLQSSLNNGHSQSAIARALQRSRATISREIARNGRVRTDYDAVSARLATDAHRRRGPCKLREGSALHIYTFAHVRLAGRRSKFPASSNSCRTATWQAPNCPIFLTRRSAGRFISCRAAKFARGSYRPDSTQLAIPKRKDRILHTQISRVEVS